MGPEAKFRGKVVAYLRSRGIEAVRIDPTAQNGLDDWPDTILLGTRGQTCWAEFKAPGAGYLRRGQKFVLDSLARRGHNALVIKSWADVHRAVALLEE